MDVKLNIKYINSKRIIELSCNCEDTIVNVVNIHSYDYEIKHYCVKKRFKYFGTKTYHVILKLIDQPPKDLTTALKEAI